jgi:HK97 family phage major capsid protein
MARKEAQKALTDAFLESLRAKSLDDLGDNPEELRGKTYEELVTIATELEDVARSIHQTETGEIRDVDAAESRALEVVLALREKAIAKADEHVAIQEVIRRQPKAMETAFVRSSGGNREPEDVRRMSVSEARDKAMRVLDSREARGLKPDQKDRLEDLIDRDTDTARRILVTETEHYRSAWMKLLTGNTFLDDEEQRAVRAFMEYRVMSEGTTSAGGFGVPVFIDPSIILTSQGSPNPFLRIASESQVTTNFWKGVSSAGVSWSFDAEHARVSDDSPTLAQPAIQVEMARGFIPYSIEVGEDYPGFASEMGRLLAEGYDELLVEKFTLGAGHSSTEPTGILTALDANTNVEIATTTAGAFGLPDVFKVWNALPARAQANATWMMDATVNAAIRAMGTANNFYGATVDLTKRIAPTLLEAPVEINPYMPDLVLSTTTTDNLLIVGDFRNYKIVRRGGMSIEFVPQLFQQQTAGTGGGMPTGERGWFAHARVGGGSTNDLGFRLLQDKT